MVLNGDASLKGFLAVLDGCLRGWSAAEREAAGQELLALAKHARINRRFDTLENISSLICDLLPDTHFARTALYYKAYCLHRRGAASATQARANLEMAVDIAPPECKPGALLALACGHLDTGEINEFAVVSLEAAKAARGVDALSEIQALRALAISRALLGDHTHAFSMLTSLLPVMREVAAIYPADYLSHLNSLALEMGELGQVDEALNVIEFVLRSPLAAGRSQWHETKTELSSKQRRIFTPFTLALGAPTVEAAPVEPSNPSAGQTSSVLALGRATANQIVLPRVRRLDCGKVLPFRPRVVQQPTQNLLATAPPLANTNRGYAISPPARAPPTPTVVSNIQISNNKR